MKRKSAWRSGLTFLIVAVLLVIAFFRGPEEPRLLGGVFAVWAVWMFIAILLRPFRARSRVGSGNREVPPQSGVSDEYYDPGINDTSDCVHPDAVRQPDPEVWYSLEGRTMLENCISELYLRGYDGLTIKENGDICTRQTDSEAIHDTLRNMPDRSTWQALLKVFESDGLAASVTEEGIIMSW